MKDFLRIEVDRKRVFGLDLLRAFAIFCVVHGHGKHYLEDTALHFLTQIPLPHGVDIFFVMSGYLIGKSFLAYAERNNSLVGWPKTLLFYARTALRIVPNYLFILLVYYFLVRFEVIGGNLQAFPMWRFATFTQNLVTPFWDFYWESWSLPVQWWFYILFPLLLTLTCLFANPKKSVPVICLVFVIISMVYRAMVTDKVYDSFMWDVWIRRTVASRCDNVYIGVMAAWVKQYYPQFWDRHAVKSLVVGLLLFVVSILLPGNIGSVYSNVFYLTLSALAVALWFPFFSKIKSYKTGFGKAVSVVSILSYAMFLTNLMMVQIIDAKIPWLVNHGIVGYFVYWLMMMTASYLLHVLIEKPFVRLRDRL